MSLYRFVKSLYKFKQRCPGSGSVYDRSGCSNGAYIYYNIYNMSDRCWWFLPWEIVDSSGFVRVVGDRVDSVLRGFVSGRLGSINVLGVDAAAGYGKSVAAVRLAVDLSYDGWLVIIGFHSHELGRKLFEYVLRYMFVKFNVRSVGRAVRIGPLVLPRVVYVGGMDRYCPFFNIVADRCDERDKTCHVVRYMLEKAGVPRHMWGKPVKFLIEHKILNAKQFCDICPLMRKKGRLRRIPKDYWPDSRSRFGPRILYTRDVADVVEKYLFSLMYSYDYRRRKYVRTCLSRYVKLIDPRVGVCPRRLLLKPIFSRRYKRKSDGKVVFYNFWLYHGGLVILAPYELALKVARIAYHVRKGKKILFIVDEADALLFKKGYVPVFPPVAFRREFELLRVYVEYLLWLFSNERVDYDVAYKKFREIVGKYIRRKDGFLVGLFNFVYNNRDRVDNSVTVLLKVFFRLVKHIYSDADLDDLLSYLNNDKVLDEVSRLLAGLVGELGRDGFSELWFLDDADYEALRFWNLLYVLSMGRQERIGIGIVGGNAEKLVRVRYRGVARIVNVDKKISPLLSLYLLNNSFVSIVLINNMLYYEYYPYLYKLFDLAGKGVRVVLLSASLGTYFVNIGDIVAEVADKTGAKFKVLTLLSVNDIYFVERGEKRVVVISSDVLRNVRVHRFLALLPRYVVKLYKSRFGRGISCIIDVVKKYRCVIVTQNKVTAKYLAHIVSSVIGGDIVGFDSGYYVKGRVLITWLRSKLNRGVNIQDIDPGFVPSVFVFVGTFMSSVQRVGVYLYNDPSDDGFVTFLLPFVDRVYFVSGIVDRFYGAEVLCWIEQFIGRALRVSRMFNVRVYVGLPSNVLRFGWSTYLLAVKHLPDRRDVEHAYAELCNKYIWLLKKLDDPELPDRYKRIFVKRLKKIEMMISDPRLLFEHDVYFSGLDLGLLKNIGLGYLVKQAAELLTSVV